MDFMQIIFLWLKSFLERMKTITSFISGDFLPEEDEEDDDFEFGFSPIDKPNKKS